MNEFTPNSIWLIGFFVLIAIAIIAAIIHHNTAKTDRVNRNERDTIFDSVSISPSKEKRKID